MSSAGRAASSSGCVVRPREHETGLTGYAESIQRSLPTGSSAMETAEHREPYESRGSRTDLGAPGGETPPGDSTFSAIPARRRRGRSTSISGPSPREPRGSPLTEVKNFRTKVRSTYKQADVCALDGTHFWAELKSK